VSFSESGAGARSPEGCEGLLHPRDPLSYQPWHVHARLPQQPQRLGDVRAVDRGRAVRRAVRKRQPAEDLGFGRIAASDTEAPNMSAIPV
jgi:hypothetical protein